MNIIFGDAAQIEQLESKYLALELDSFIYPGSDQIMTAWCVLDNLSISDMVNIDQQLDLHRNLIKNYRLRNWNYCEQAIEHLKNKWGGQLDSFYDDLLARVIALKKTPVPQDWSPVILKN